MSNNHVVYSPIVDRLRVVPELPVAQLGDLVDAARILSPHGQWQEGLRTIAAVAVRMAEARAKHPEFAEGIYQALGVIEAEMRELSHAVEHESFDRVRDELLDVIVTCLKLYGSEHEHDGE